MSTTGLIDLIPDFSNLFINQLGSFLLIKKGFANKDTSFTYACGQLAFIFNKDISLYQLCNIKNFSRISIANPSKAPYGEAAIETLQKLGLLSAFKNNLVYGNSVAQVFHFVASGNIEGGFISKSLTFNLQNKNYILVPRNFHKPIKQNAVLINNEDISKITASKQFLNFLKGRWSRQYIVNAGYFNEC